MSEHTKGPWVIDGDYILEQGKCADPFDNIAVVGDKDEWQSNANLIAAAPVMHAALKLCVEALTWNTGGEPMGTLEVKALEAAKAVLEKVEERE